ncbi:hypothetical protein TVAG_475100 [Trichomonas vaginalis G3]|uniref:E2F/DP family winged-helix DNA-binding domain-containing protein n=1 Tax=Trichomonas vaginalis (strain ATCC PRA-98 / G3) TaxID=412133 RepID=A2EM17_TRIV3|nr:winged helix DNA-binding domain family [Trichomonas vaginalis G3]EAY06276.1 hypothetical protein TVAG_475100 [Trichomonas vaginalis G3]KAI5503354.1 winged helix DNA-binding domain family [Trichomonas vaginalis G3]|eukprot:XP_001318499.1 hypothetical protein [Trichomonas vaginalis G3]
MFTGYVIPPRPQEHDDLKTCIMNLVSEFEQKPDESKAITQLSTRYKIKRRRLYDVINVYTSLGCCQKTCLDHVIWLGKEKIIPGLKALIIKEDINNPNKTLEELFPVNGCIGIANLTLYFLLLFYALKSNKVDIRFAAQFFSRGTGRYKTTLCKLYQISYILNAIHVTTRSEQVCEVILNPPFITSQDIVDDPVPQKNNLDSIMSIEQLLNRPIFTNTDNYVIRRREEMRECFVKNISAREAEAKIPAGEEE